MVGGDRSVEKEDGVARGLSRTGPRSVMTSAMEAHSRAYNEALKCLPKPNWLF